MILYVDASAYFRPSSDHFHWLYFANGFIIRMGTSTFGVHYWPINEELGKLAKTEVDDIKIEKIIENRSDLIIGFEWIMNWAK